MKTMEWIKLNYITKPLFRVRETKNKRLQVRVSFTPQGPEYFYRIIARNHEAQFKNC